MEPGVQTPEETLRKGIGLVPRLGLAAGAAAAPPRAGGALRLGLPDPAHGRREVARRPVRHRERFHRPACLVRGLPARRGLDRPRSDLGPARRRRPHPARLHAGAVSAAPVTGALDECEVEFEHAHEGGARLGSAARHQALHRRAVGGRSSARPRDRRATSPRDDVRLTMGGEPTFVSIDDPRRRGMEHRRRSARQARLRRATCTTGCAASTRRRACCTSARASGTRASRCRAGRSTVSGARTASRSGETRR